MKKLNKKVPISGGAVIGVRLVIYIILCFLASGNGFIKNMTINGIKVNNMSKDEIVTQHGDNGDQCIAQRVAEDQRRAGNALALGQQHIIGVQNLNHLTSGKAGNGVFP